MSDAIERLNTALGGRYEVEREIGEGGMATVFLAKDLKHNRNVALKVLKPELAAVVGAERFLAEIKTTANLQHPHILPLFDSGEADSFLFYVMPYVEGETLRARISRDKQLPVDEAVRIATDVAGALQYAHAQGVVHRDIKPANILLHAGKPVISDFGIALAVGTAGQGRLTETGLSLGTPHYMSPEQATGDQTVGASTDVYAIGAVLYEMLVGEPPYTGSTAQAILGKIISGSVASAAEERASVPPNVDAAIRRALEKVPADRFSSAQDLADALADPGFRLSRATHPDPASDAGAWKRIAVGSAVIAAATSFALGWTVLRPEPPVPIERFRAYSTQDGSRGGAALSSDGSVMVHQAPDSAGQWRLWLRRWSDVESIPIQGGERGYGPAVSPDGTEVAFFDGSLQGADVRVVPVDGGIPRTLSQDGRCCMRWGPDGYVYYQAQGGNIHRVAIGGGTPEVVALRGEGEPGFLADFQTVPGSDWGVYFAWGPHRVIARHLPSGEEKELATGTNPFVTESGHLVYSTPDGRLHGAPLNVKSMELTGPAISLVDGVSTIQNGYASHFVSYGGRLVYWTGDGGLQGGRGLVWVDRFGRQEALEMEPQVYWHPRLSPTGDRLAVAFRVDDGTDIWAFDLARGTGARVTYGGNNRFFPVWSPSGGQLAYSDGTTSPNAILLGAADGSGSDTLLAIDGLQYPTSWSADGRLLAFSETNPETGRDLWVLPLGGEPEPFLVTPFMEQAPVFSPDGRWIAFVSDKSGQDEVYVRPYPGPGPEVVVSTHGGGEPLWARDGSELFYRGPNDMMTVDARNPNALGTPQPLWTDIYWWAQSPSRVANYDVTADGQRFIMVGDLVRENSLIVVPNFGEALKRSVPK
ncbi:MAG: protein kinase [Gemmatimonadetes bacterium]|nr:protein kinase [Gemmatimonadota bacterium]